jgi:hypothetical protein
MATFCPAVFDRYILPFRIAVFAQSLAERSDKRGERARRRQAQEPDHRHRLLLRAERERQRTRRAASKSDELTPRHSITSSVSHSGLADWSRASWGLFAPHTGTGSRSVGATFQLGGMFGARRCGGIEETHMPASIARWWRSPKQLAVAPVAILPRGRPLERRAAGRGVRGRDRRVPCRGPGTAARVPALTRLTTFGTVGLPVV